MKVDLKKLGLSPAMEDAIIAIYTKPGRTDTDGKTVRGLLNRKLVSVRETKAGKAVRLTAKGKAVYKAV